MAVGLVILVLGGRGRRILGDAGQAGQPHQGATGLVIEPVSKNEGMKWGTHTFESRTSEAEAGRSLGVPGQSGLYRDPVRNKQTKNSRKQ